MGGPQVNGLQLLLAGEADVLLGYDFQTINAVAQGLPVVAIGASFQKDLQGILTHADVQGLDGLSGKTILVSTPGRTSFWPWLKAKYGLSDDQVRPYTFSLQPFLADPQAVQQAFPTSEPFPLERDGVAHHFYLFADAGYPPYGSSWTTRADVIATKAGALRRFVYATALGWKSYLADPSAGNKLIQADNPKMSDDQLAFAIRRLEELRVVTGGDAATMGIGVITEDRFRKTYDYMVAAGLQKPGVDWKKAIDTSFVTNSPVLPN